MASKGSDASVAVWLDFDRALADASPSSPWTRRNGATTFEPDVAILRELLSIPVRHRVDTQTGLPAKALDVWLAHELRRAGFSSDHVWPRPTRPRVLSSDIAALLTRVPRGLSRDLLQWLERNTVKGAAVSDALVLGKAYQKQVDVVMAHWSRGPEIMVSTKRMDSSFSNNTANRIEETYGDGKNLRGRHPLAALGYLMCVRSTVLTQAPAVFEKLANLLEIMALEDDAYDATGLILVDWPDSDPSTITGQDLVLDQDNVPPSLRIERFLTTVVDIVLARSPVALHAQVREQRNGVQLAVSVPKTRGTRGETVQSRHVDEAADSKSPAEDGLATET